MMFGRGSFPFRIAYKSYNQGLCLCETFKGVNSWEWSFHLQLFSLQDVFSSKKTPVPCSFSWIFTPSWWPDPTVKIGYTLVKELKVKHLIFSNLKTLDRYLVPSNQRQTLMSNRFETYLVCLALVASSCETLTKLAMLKPWLKKTAIFDMHTTTKNSHAEKNNKNISIYIYLS